MAAKISPPPAMTLSDVSRLPLNRRVRHPLYWTWVRFMVFGRAVPACLFAFMGYVQLGHVRGAVAGLRAGTGAAAALGRVAPPTLYLVFCCIPVGLYLTRGMPLARDGRVVARSAAFVGTTMQLFVGVLVTLGPLLYSPPVWAQDLASLLGALALSFAIVSMGYLRRNLSIVPEARRLVTGGPYRLVRHPLYLAEITAAVAVVVAEPYLTRVLSLVAFVCMQTVRARFEDRLLGDTFPGHAAYLQRTRRLIPFAW